MAVRVGMPEIMRHIIGVIITEFRREHLRHLQPNRSKSQISQVSQMVVTTSREAMSILGNLMAELSRMHHRSLVVAEQDVILVHRAKVASAAESKNGGLIILENCEILELK